MNNQRSNKCFEPTAQKLRFWVPSALRAPVSAQAADATKYILEVCDTSGLHKPVARFESDTPFMPVNIGDRFDDTGWAKLDGVSKIASPSEPKCYTVHSIKHLIISDGNTLLITYCLNLQSFTGPRSPVWSDD